MPRILVYALLPSLMGLVACGGSVYELSAPPPRDEWVDLSQTQEETEEAKIRRFLDAKRVAIATYAAMQEQDWETVTNNMSQETLNFLEEASGGGDPEDALAKGELALGGKSIQFDPVADFFIADLADLRDEVSGQDEAETERRKELWAVSRDGKARKVLFIYEADAWRFHSPFIRTRVVEGVEP